MNFYDLETLVAHARAHSPFYRELYRDLPARVTSVTDLPVVDQRAFWAANDWQSNRLLAGPVSEGIVFRSGGTTGTPKFSVFTRAEWETFTAVFGRGLAAGGLAPGERVGNVFYAGSLYASFLFIGDSLARSPVGAVSFPIGGATEPADSLAMITDFKVTTLAGVPTTLLALANAYDKDRDRFPGLKVTRVLFGGESMYEDQRQRLRAIWPNVHIQSVGYASVDAGLLGYADASCKADEHRVFSDATLLEIVDEVGGAPITKTGVPGRVLVTNLTRKMMPILRYPVGDRAEWVDDPKKTVEPRFVLRGRSEEAARVGPVSVYFEDIAGVFAAPATRASSWGVQAFQLFLDHAGECDRLTIRVAVQDPASIQAQDTGRLLEAIYRERPMLRDAAEAGKIHPTQVEWVGIDGLSANARTGKLRRVIDRRYG